MPDTVSIACARNTPTKIADAGDLFWATPPRNHDFFYAITAADSAPDAPDVDPGIWSLLPAGEPFQRMDVTTLDGYVWVCSPQRASRIAVTSAATA